MKISTKRGKLLLGAGALAAVAAVSLGTAQYAVGSDHADTVESVTRPSIDLTDLHIFPGQNASNVVLALSVRPLIPAGQAANFSFDPDVLYQFKIDTSGDNVEDLVLQARFEGTGPTQKVFISGPVKPSRIGLTTQFETPYAKTGVINQAFSPDAANQVRVFAGARADSFFLDLAQFGVILPDRLSAVPANAVPGLKTGQTRGSVQAANTPEALTWRAPGQARDFFVNQNLLSIIVEMPRTMLADPTTRQVGRIGVWETASIRNN